MTNTSTINTISKREDDKTMINIKLSNEGLTLPLNIDYGDHFDSKENEFMFPSFYLGNCLEATTQELQHVFTNDEFNLLLTLITSYSPLSLLNASAKEYLKTNTVDTIKYNEYPDLIGNIDPDALIEKLDQLTEFQVFSVIYLLHSYLENYVVKDFFINE